MKVRVEENLYIESDNLSFQLREYTGKTDSNGKELYKTLGYYSSLGSVINGVFKRKIKLTTVESLRELQGEVLRIEKDISLLIEETRNIKR